MTYQENRLLPAKSTFLPPHVHIHTHMSCLLVSNLMFLTNITPKVQHENTNPMFDYSYASSLIVFL